MSLPDVPPIHAARELADTLDEALDMLREFSSGSDSLALAHETPASLLEQCVALCSQHRAAQPEAVRTVHHFACSGGTLISKCLAAMPNTQMLSEVDPLSTIQVTPGQPQFAPTDFVLLMRQSTRGAGPELLAEMFLNNLQVVHAEASRQGQRLILRDHAHSHFCVGDDIPERPSLHDMVASRFPTLSVMTVRHPGDSFLSLEATGWVHHFSPFNIDEYSRRYLAFIEAHPDIPRVKYEHFTQDPTATMQVICGHLELPYFEQFMRLFEVFALTGDSGRKGDVIEPRPRRDIPANVAAEMAASSNYRQLLEILDYD